MNSDLDFHKPREVGLVVVTEKRSFIYILFRKYHQSLWSFALLCEPRFLMKAVIIVPLSYGQ